MAAIGYPDLATHAAVHDRLLSKIEEHRDAAVKILGLTDELFVFLRDWLSAHMLRVDQGYAAYAVNQEIPSAGR